MRTKEQLNALFDEVAAILFVMIQWELILRTIPTNMNPRRVQFYRVEEAVIRRRTF